MDLTEAEDIKKRWQEYTKELYKKDLQDPDNHEDVITHTHLEPDILEFKVKWALRSITTNKAIPDGFLFIGNWKAVKTFKMRYIVNFVFQIKEYLLK